VRVISTAKKTMYRKPAQSPEARTAAYLRRRRRTRVVAVFLIAIITTTIVAAHVHNPPDDTPHFNHHGFLVTAAPAADIITIRDGDHDEPVQLLAVAAPHRDEHGADHARTYTATRLVGKRVTLLLEPPETRDAGGHLLAYVFPLDVDNLNVDIVKDGMAYADRRVHTMLTPTIEQSEADARKHTRGLWKGLDFAGMPEWRRTWLQQLRSHTSAGHH